MSLHKYVQVTVKELWNILCEMKLRGTLTKTQFDKCVKYVLIDATGKDDDMVSTCIRLFIVCASMWYPWTVIMRLMLHQYVAILFPLPRLSKPPLFSYSTSFYCLTLPSLHSQSNPLPTAHLSHSQLDYEALCRYTVRMGRSFNSVVQEMRVTDEKTYALLKEGLKKGLLAMMDASNRCVSRLLSCIPIFVTSPTPSHSNIPSRFIHYRSSHLPPYFLFDLNKGVCHVHPLHCFLCTN